VVRFQHSTWGWLHSFGGVPGTSYMAQAAILSCAHPSTRVQHHMMCNEAHREEASSELESAAWHAACQLRQTLGLRLCGVSIAQGCVTAASAVWADARHAGTKPVRRLSGTPVRAGLSVRRRAGRPGTEAVGCLCARCGVFRTQAAARKAAPGVGGVLSQSRLERSLSPLQSTVVWGTARQRQAKAVTGP
jgi:hypothetical protein